MSTIYVVYSEPYFKIISNAHKANFPLTTPTVPPPPSSHHPQPKNENNKHNKTAQPHHKRKTINTTNTIGIRPPDWICWDLYDICLNFSEHSEESHPPGVHARTMQLGVGWLLELLELLELFKLFCLQGGGCRLYLLYWLFSFSCWGAGGGMGALAGKNLNKSVTNHYKLDLLGFV